ncbi:hypothetical protein PC41400_06085 [Paenibacillus chitinolyticus]|uniref:Uncharacterized protein n=1 Tax=Paenibacillus chitinolyticus TaxID=79263 RepID=A0A410WSA2_9BACL|nr:hypothetical protein [Paenibacillus chitinolyticus]MCY9589029.1 hypothetical protein [Paenibacillus chitinolyticus]MCY9595483.1 hypothetical protein [Paenibacillus chitinolyticus]QAV17255.1 hypothetical protein PC41400_06085 [Paenibacillus chitinolyticus]GKS10632.1 hypothetical protein YDYSY3_16320 [Paenibacillus chitinolyticus]
MKKISIFMLSVSLVLMFVFSSSGFAAPIDNKVKFEQYLYNLDKSDPLVSEQIQKYNKLSETEKSRLVELIYDPNVTKQAFDSMKTVALGRSTSISNGEVVIQSKVEESSNKKRAITTASEESYWGSYSWTMTFLGIDLTTLKTKVFYTIDGNNNVLSADTAVNSHWNIDPLVIVSDGVSSAYKSGGYAYGNGPFTVYGTATLGFISASVSVIVKSKPGDTTGWKESAIT